MDLTKHYFCSALDELSMPADKARLLLLVVVIAVHGCVEDNCCTT